MTNNEPTAEQLADKIWSDIQDDIASGQVPAHVATFSELHSHVDANMYALGHIDFNSSDEHYALMNAAETIVNNRLAETAPERLATEIMRQIDADISAEVMPVTVTSLHEAREYVEIDDYMLGRGVLLAAQVDGDKAAALLIERALAVVDAKLTERGSNGTLEAECDTCGEMFIPTSSDDMIHVAKQDGTECGGYGRLRGVFYAQGMYPPAEAPTTDEPSDGMSTAELAAELATATEQRERIERAALSPALPGTPEHEALRRSDCGGMLWCRCAVVSPHTRRAETVLMDGKRIEESRVHPTKQTHDFVNGSGRAAIGLCWQQVERPNGAIVPCGEPVKSPVHDPAAYLAYDAELRTELKKWVAGEGEYMDPREDLIHPFE
jgi:hypothetical protein